MLAAIKMTVIGLILGSIATPLYLKLLMSTTVAIPEGEVFSRILLLVFLPMLAGYATQLRNGANAAREACSAPDTQVTSARTISESDVTLRAQGASKDMEWTITLMKE